MSFSNNCKPEKMPGPIKGNPLTGMCERACVQVDKIFDACMRQETLEDVNICIQSYFPTTLCPPFKFISGKSVATKACVEDLTITELPDMRGCARVTCNIVIPMNIVVTDEHGVPGVVCGVLKVPKDIVLHVASESVMPYEIIADATVVVPEGKFCNHHQELILTATCCVTIIIKVIMRVSLLVPSYGYAYIPPCQEFSQDVCDGIFDLPLYPNDCGCDT